MTNNNSNIEYTVINIEAAAELTAPPAKNIGNTVETKIRRSDFYRGYSYMTWRTS